MVNNIKTIKTKNVQSPCVERLPNLVACAIAVPDELSGRQVPPGSRSPHLPRLCAQASWTTWSPRATTPGVFCAASAGSLL